MRWKVVLLLGLSVMSLVGCRSSCGSPSLWDRLTHRKSNDPCQMMPMGEAVFADPGCAECGAMGSTTSMLPDAEPILTAPAKVGGEPKKDVPANAPGYAEPMPFSPKKP